MVGLRASSKSFERQYREKVASLVKLTGTVPAHLDAKSIHDLRVTIRRITVMTKLLPRKTRESVDAQKFQLALKSLLKATAEARDSDILKDALEAHLSIVPREILDALNIKRNQAESAARGSMKVFPAKLAPSVNQSEIDAKKLSAKLSKKVKKRGSAVQALLVKAVGDESRVTDLHKLRIEVKKLRYLLELAEDASRDLKVLIRWQDALGEIHDLDVAVYHLRSNYSEEVKKKLLGALEKARHDGFRAFIGQLKADLKVLKVVSAG
jgi:CHAD domain-containing protein